MNNSITNFFTELISYFDFDNIARKINDFFGTDFSFDFRNLYKSIKSIFNDISVYISQNEGSFLFIGFCLFLFVLFFFFSIRIIKSKDRIGSIVFFVTKPFFWFIIGPWTYQSLLTNDKHSSPVGVSFFVLWFFILFMGTSGIIAFGIPLGFLCQWIFGDKHRSIYQV